MIAEPITGWTRKWNGSFFPAVRLPVSCPPRITKIKAVSRPWACLPPQNCKRIRPPSHAAFQQADLIDVVRAALISLADPVPDVTCCFDKGDRQDQQDGRKVRRLGAHKALGHKTQHGARAVVPVIHRPGNDEAGDDEEEQHAVLPVRKNEVIIAGNSSPAVVQIKWNRYTLRAAKARRLPMMLT